MYLCGERSVKSYHPRCNWYQFILVYLLFTISNENDANPLKVIKTMLEHNRKCLLTAADILKSEVEELWQVIDTN